MPHCERCGRVQYDCACDGEDALTIHPRHIPCQGARKELSAFLLDWNERHGLSAAEYLQLVTEALSSELRLLVQGEREQRGQKR